jgi:hypothetical protein
MNKNFNTIKDAFEIFDKKKLTEEEIAFNGAIGACNFNGAFFYGGWHACLKHIADSIHSQPIIGEPLSFEPYQEPFNEEKFAAKIAFEIMKTLLKTNDGYFTSEIGQSAYGIVDIMLEEHWKRFPKKGEKR